MKNQEIVVFIAKHTVTLIDEIQNKLKIMNSASDQMNYLILTELYSLRTRTYIVRHEPNFFELDQEILESQVLNTFNLIKSKVAKTENLVLLKKITFLISMLVASIGVGETENILKILNEIDSLSVLH
ncbi:hypothetical protein ACG9HX_12555 [Acinetobacter ursingii]|uniref:hypothetical protein n=1 Tax=Acinetobacter TaxID=469 RepID=UPI0009927DC4|nr:MULTISPECIES: hypothetical protein [Acinetobacter calcoaceticus/baumannii complex]MBJ9724925.1 hypothetical protein [Acinetobacter nosocomialis]MBP1509812.1 hypothetical protein [Acinetobacter nosocomialis]MCU4467942.1 hypothetical protein [Acinetobacter pittii]OOS67801.1 hypothetical protein BTG60_05160 [Acinetobacter pittii]RSO16749.1 hypothetical protein EA759_08430 [Acinetobacter pittii]